MKEGTDLELQTPPYVLDVVRLNRLNTSYLTVSMRIHVVVITEGDHIASLAEGEIFFFLRARNSLFSSYNNVVK